MIKFTKGDMFDIPADIRINTVNCVGAMGAGVALAFKKRYPEMFKDYKQSCNDGLVRPGKPHLWENYDFCESLIIINFPTKDHWKKPSEYKYIEDGLVWLKDYLSHHGNATVTLPALGCGHGGLDWNIVKKMISKYLSNLNAEILVFEPADSHAIGNKLSDIHKKELEIKGVKIITPSDEYYPEHLKGKSAKNLYVLGSIDIFSSSLLATFVSRKLEQKEQAAIDLCLPIILEKNIIPILSNSAGDRHLIKQLLQLHKKLIICIDTGILNFKIPKELNELWDDGLVTIVSSLSPEKEWYKFNYKETIKLKIYLAKAILVTAMNPTWITKLSNELKEAFRGAYYIHYSVFSENDFNLLNNIDAIAVSKSFTGTPKLDNLFDRLLNKQNT